MFVVQLVRALTCCIHINECTALNTTASTSTWEHTHRLHRGLMLRACAWIQQFHQVWGRIPSLRLPHGLALKMPQPHSAVRTQIEVLHITRDLSGTCRACMYHQMRGHVAPPTPKRCQLLGLKAANGSAAPALMRSKQGHLGKGIASPHGHSRPRARLMSQSIEK